MNRIRWFLVLVPVFSLVAGCNKIAPLVAEQPVTAEDVQAARRAMSISEVSLMVRSGYDQKKILADVQRRHVPEAIDRATEESLVSFGAKPPLISALKNEANILTPQQRQAFDELRSQIESRIASQPIVPAYATEPIDEPLRQTVVPVVKTANVHVDTPEEAYWKAEAAYRAKRSELEAKITSQQGYINRMRSYGYHQSTLASAEDRLHQYEDELKNLQAPIR